MSTEPTSILVFGDLLLEIALKAGMAYYGEEGDEEAQIPIDDHDLAEVKRHANNAIRMFIADAPPMSGWRWTRVVSDLVLWADLAVDASRTVSSGTYDSMNDQTPLTANTAVFHESMEEKTIVVTGQGSFVIKRYVSSTQVYVYGNHIFAGTATYSIASGGNFTLPRSFTGTFNGVISFEPQTNRAVTLRWTDEGVIRRMRENVESNTGTPIELALSSFVPEETGRRRWQIAAFPTPDEEFTIQVPFELHFDKLEDSTDPLPMPVTHDEAVKAACLAVVEKDVDGTPNGPAMTFYKEQLGRSHRADARSAPKRLGYFGNRKAMVTVANFREFMSRPNVVYNTP